MSRVAAPGTAAPTPLGRRRLLQCALGLSAFALVPARRAHALGVTYTTPMEATFQALLSRPAITITLGRLGGESPALFDAHKRLAAMPAAGRLAARRAFLLAGLREAGLAEARVDTAGNVIAERPGSKRAPRLLIAARLDAPEQGRGLLVLLTTLRHLQAQQLGTIGDLVVVGLDDTAGERGPAAALDAARADGLLLFDGTAGAGGTLLAPAVPGDEPPLFAVTRRAAQLLAAPTPAIATQAVAVHARRQGIPAVLLGDGVTGAPAPDQVYQPAGEWRGPQMMLLCALALAGAAGVSDPLLATAAASAPSP